ncbi:ATP-binding protein [Frateuria aurantia]
MRIAHKVFVLLAATTVLALFAFSLGAALNLRRGLLNYINLRQVEQVEMLRDGLAAYWSDHGSFAPLSQPSAWRQWLRMVGRDDDNRDGRGGGGPGHAADVGGRHDHHGPHHDNHGMRWAWIARVGLWSAPDNRRISGPMPLSDARREPIMVDDAVVGWLVYSPQHEIDAPHDLDFLHGQWLEMSWTLLLVLLLALPVSYAFTRHLVRPLAAVTRVSARLADGDYTARLGSSRRDEIGELIRHVDALAEALQRHESTRRRWVADIAHELRTPLTVLRGELEAIQDGLHQADGRALAILIDEVGRLDSLVSDLHELTVAELQAFSYRREPMELAEWVEQAFQRFRPLAAEQGLQLRLRVPGQPVWILGDTVRLRQLLDNLLSNSLRYTDRGGQILLELASSGETVMLSVSDSAPGVAMDDLPRLFEPLFRVESSRNRAAGGSGLGLAIARGIAEAHHGRLWAEASVLGGLRVVLSLPVSPAEQAA